MQWKRDHMDAHAEFGSYSEKVRLELEDELRNDPVKWSVLTFGIEAIVEFFMSGIWRTDTGASAVTEHEDQLSFHWTFDGKKLPSDITYFDPTAGKTRMRTVAIQHGRLWQWQKAVELKYDKAKEAGEAADRDHDLGARMLRAAGGDINAKIIEVCDRIEDAA